LDFRQFYKQLYFDVDKNIYLLYSADNGVAPDLVVNCDFTEQGQMEFICSVHGHCIESIYEWYFPHGNLYTGIE